jgi:hypothetical protein
MGGKPGTAHPGIRATAGGTTATDIRVTNANPVTARKTESHLIQLIDPSLVRPAASPKTPSKKK